MQPTRDILGLGPLYVEPQPEDMDTYQFLQDSLPPSDDGDVMSVRQSQSDIGNHPMRWSEDMHDRNPIFDVGSGGTGLLQRHDDDLGHDVAVIAAAAEYWANPELEKRDDWTDPEADKRKRSPYPSPNASPPGRYADLQGTNVMVAVPAVNVGSQTFPLEGEKSILPRPNTQYQSDGSTTRPTERRTQKRRQRQSGSVGMEVKGK